MKRKLTIGLILIMLVPGVQASRLDSLLSVWQDHSIEDQKRANAYAEYIRSGFSRNDPDSAVTLSKQLINFCEQVGYLKGRARGAFLLGDAQRLTGRQNEALVNYHKSLDLYKETGDTVQIAQTYVMIGHYHNAKGEYVEAYRNYKEGIALLELLGDERHLRSALTGMGNLYNKQGLVQKANQYYQRCYDITIRNGLTGGPLGNLGSIASKQGRIEAALEYQLKNHEQNVAMGDEIFIAISLSRLALLYERLGRIDTVHTLLRRSLGYLKKVGHKRRTSDLLYENGMYHLKYLSLDSATYYCEQAYALAKESQGMEEKAEACECLQEAYKKAGRFMEALKHGELKRRYTDSLNQSEIVSILQREEFAEAVLNDSLSRVEAIRNQEAQRASVLRDQEKSRNVFIASGLLLLLLSGGFWQRFRLVKRSQREIQREKDRSEELLLNILPFEIAEELKVKGASEARDYDLVSVLRTDFQDFTKTSEKIGADELVDELNICFKEFDRICERYGVEKIKTIGDAYLAAGGLPLPTDDAVRQTVFAALEMQSFILQRKEDNLARGKIFFEMRLGIHTGPVVAGIVGVKKFQYDIWGDTVNTASRMESSGEVGKVNISHSTYELIKDDPDFVFEKRGKIEAKGKGEMEMWFVKKR